MSNKVENVEKLNSIQLEIEQLEKETNKTASLEHKLVELKCLEIKLRSQSKYSENLEKFNANLPINRYECIIGGLDLRISALLEEIELLEQLEKEVASEQKANVQKKIFKVKNVRIKLGLKKKKQISLNEYRQLPQELRDEKKTDHSFYTQDKLSFLIVLVVIVAQLYYVTQLLSLSTLQLSVGVTVLGNIVILLFLFTTALQIKVYKKFWSYFIIGFAVYQLIRLFYILPIYLRLTHAKFQEQLNNNENPALVAGIQRSIRTLSNVQLACIIMLIVAVCAGIVSLKKIIRQEAYIKSGKITFKQMSK